jgi:hypothetical protein
MHQQAPTRPEHRHDLEPPASPAVAWLAALVFVVALGVVALGVAAG